MTLPALLANEIRLAFTRANYQATAAVHVRDIFMGRLWNAEFMATYQRVCALQPNQVRPLLVHLPHHADPAKVASQMVQ